MVRRSKVHTFARQRGFQLPRPRLMTLLSEIPEVPLTVIKAGAGYGKTTAAATYCTQTSLSYKWFTVREEDTDSVRFVERLCGVLLANCTSERDRERVVAAAHSPLTWLTSAQWAGDFAQSNVQQEEIWIFDDFHLLDEDAAALQWIERLLRRLPQTVHVVLVTRTSPSLPIVEALTLRDGVLWVRERELAFTEEEVGFLFGEGTRRQPADPAISLKRQQVRWLLARTGGMSMVLAMLLRDWQQHASYARLQAALEQQTSLTEQIGTLFLEDLSVRERDFLRNTCLFSTLHPDLCDKALGLTTSNDVLANMERKGHLVLSDDGVSYELHPLVRDYLAQGLSEKQLQGMVECAILWHLERDEESKAISYFFAYRNEELAAAALLPYIPRYLARGQISTVQGWIERFHLNVLEHCAGLLLAKGEVLRHVNRFSEALELYERAAKLAECTGEFGVRAQVEMGRARLFLDTTQPAKARPHIRNARKWLSREDREARFAVLQLAFENSINSGQIFRAKRLHQLLTHLDGASLPQNNSDARLLLRTGQIQEVILLLKNRVSPDPVDGRTALAHREASLLLSLMYAMQGDGHQSKEQAQRGHVVGNSLHSPFVSAVGYIRLGHAEHLLNPLSDAALQSYQHAIELMDDMEVPRGKSEALLGLCLAHGYRRQLALAKLYAEKGIHVAQAAGDVWMASLVRVGLGQVSVINGEFQEAQLLLTQCIAAFQRCHDRFLETASRLWRALARFQLQDDRCHEDIANVLSTVERHSWDFLLGQSTYCGLKDIHLLIPLLQAHRMHGTEPRRALQVLDRLRCSELDYHPGYALRVKTFGKFAIWRGFQEITHRDWPREKARQLFLYLLTHRGLLLHREEICEKLWGDKDPVAAERDFKVALNALSTVLEPDKPGRGPSVFVLRQGPMYTLTTHSMVETDRDLFLARLEEAAALTDTRVKRERLKQGLDLYEGDYLSEVRYEDWCDNERERLRLLFVHASVEYAQMTFAARDFLETLLACQRIIEAEPAWEDAYVWMMKTYGALYNRPMVIKTYQNCERVLKQELGVLPMTSTREVYEDILSS